jgi:sec-independent protein translocase protein TatC
MATIKKEEQVTVVEVEASETRVTRKRRWIPTLPGRSGKPGKQKKPATPAGQMTFFEHLGELRNRIIWSALAAIVGTIVGFIFSKDLVGIFLDLAKPTKLVAFNLLDQFGVYMNLSIYVGLLLASPVIVYHILAFLAPALEPESAPGTPEYEQEVKTLGSIRHSLWFFIPFVAISFAGGVAFAYYLIVPSAVKFLLNFSGGQLEALLDAKKFIGDITKILFWSGVVFETPIFLFLLKKIGIVSMRGLVRWWKWALVLSLVAAAFITPSPDPFSQAIIAGPIFGLYWLGVLMARFA